MAAERGPEPGKTSSKPAHPVVLADVIEVSIPFGDAVRERLRQALGSRKDLDDIAHLLAKTGAIELLALATGEAVFQGMAELRSYRIFSLLKQGLPRGDTEILIASIFKLPIGQARRLVNAAVARYAVELGGITESIKRVLRAADWSPEPNGWLVDLSSELVRERLAATLTSMDLPDPERVRRGAIWRYPVETYNALRSAFDLPARDPASAEPAVMVPAAAVVAAAQSHEAAAPKRKPRAK